MEIEYTQKQKTSLETNRKFIASKTSEELDELMKEFDNTS